MTEDTKMTSRWADEIDDEDEQYISTSASAPQEVLVKDGERMVTEVVVDPDTGKKKKIIRTFKLENKFVSKGVIERKHWSKFGASKRDPPGPNSATTVVGDAVSMFFLGSKENDVQDDFKDLRGDGKGFVRCRFCQESHFSAKCPYKDAGIPTEFLLSNKDLTEDKKLDSESKPGVFVPPHARRGGDMTARRGETMGSSNTRKDETTIRVSNLPESMSETDLQDLCGPFGKIDRIFLAKDRATGVCKGFAFVTYQQRPHAAVALRALNGYGYDHLILNVEWSKPAAN